MEALSAAIIGIKSIPVDLAMSNLPFAVRLPLGVVSDDPSLRVRWTVIDPVTGAVRVNEDGDADERLRFSFSPQSVAPGASELIISCRVYRALGPFLTDFFNESVTLSIHDPLPPGVYIRWRYDVKNPQVQLVDETYHFAGERVVQRLSKVHRLDHPCANAAKMSRYVSSIDVRDSLPFPIQSAIENRDRLCEYCFYGGPAGLLLSL